MAEGGFTARAVGAIQIIGGGLEVALGVGGIVLPEPATTVGGVILVAHGTDTIVAGFRSLWHGEVKESLTKQGAQAAAKALGATPQTAHRIGIGVDVAAGIGPSITMSVARRFAIAGAQQSSSRIAVAYLSRGFGDYGHNAVGVTVRNSTAWFELVGTSTAKVVRSPFPPPIKDGYVITELAVTGAQSARAMTMGNALKEAGRVTWSATGTNCATTALQVLKSGGVVVPAWARSPFLLYTGVRLGNEITVVGGAAATISAPLAIE